jgi:DHA1 family multidrug resistance protein-like MFS transporter
MDERDLSTKKEKAGSRNLAAVTLTQFGTAFSLNFVNIFLPFYIFKVSPYSQRETLLWIGAIVGLTTIFTALASPLWGTLTHHYSPKMLYMRGMFTHALMFFFMAFSTNLHVLLGLRIIQGIFGGVSTAGMILISSGSKKEEQASNMGIYQAALTVGPLLGPPLGTFAAALLGYRNGFLAGAAFLFVSFIFAQIYVIDMPPLPKPVKATGKRVLDSRIMIAWIVCLVAQIQLSFLPSVLPNVFKNFSMDESTALKFAGLVVMAYTATAAFGQFAWTRLSRRFGVVRMITFLLVMGLVFQALLALTRGITDFTVVRMIQTGFAAGAIPLIISLFLDNPSGGTVGFLNASRFTGMAVGPMLATAVVAFSSLSNLYLLISAITLVAFVCFRYSFSTNTVSREQQ